MPQGVRGLIMPRTTVVTVSVKPGSLDPTLLQNAWPVIRTVTRVLLVHLRTTPTVQLALSEQSKHFLSTELPTSTAQTTAQLHSPRMSVSAKPLRFLLPSTPLNSIPSDLHSWTAASLWPAQTPTQPIGADSTWTAKPEPT